MGFNRLKKPLNKYIDHTLLKPFATDKEFESFLDEAIAYKFASVCVSPYIAQPVKTALQMTGESDIKVCTVVAFPHGNIPLNLKLHQVEFFIERGIDEIDFVLHYGELKSERFRNVELELESVGNLCRKGNVVSKCIVETCYLTDHEKRLVFDLAKDRVDFIKTSTGYGQAGATVEDVSLWASLRGGNSRPKIKAAGGIKDLSKALSLIDAGADRLGMSSSVEVMEEYNLNANSTFTEGEEKV